MASDANIFAQANKPTTALIDPNTMLLQTAQAAQAVNANRLFQSNQARGELMQQSIDPATGQFSPTAFNRLLAQTPAAALSASEGVGQSQNLMTTQNDLASKQNQYMRAALPAVLSVPDAQMHDAAVNQYLEAASQGLIKPEDAMRQMIRLPNDPAALRQHLTVLQQGLMTPQGQQANNSGTNSSQDNGQNIIAGTTAPARLGGGFTGATVTPVYPPRSLLASRTTVGVNPDGSVVTGPLANVTPPNLAGPAGQSSPLGTGRLPSALRNPNGPAGAAPAQAPATAPAMSSAAGAARASTPPPAVAMPPSAVATPAAGNGEVTTGLGPAQTAAQTATGAQSADAFKEIANQGVAAQSRGAVLDNMLSDTTQFTSGPLNDRLLKLRQVAGRLGMNVNTDATTAQESFNKLAAQLANQQGGGTDARLSVSQAGNPHADLSPDGLDQMLRQLRGNEDYIGARAKLAAVYPNPADRTGFEAGVGAQLDPRTFQYDRLTPDQKGKYFATIQDKAAFVRAHEAAAKLLAR